MSSEDRFALMAKLLQTKDSLTCFSPKYLFKVKLPGNSFKKILKLFNFPLDRAPNFVSFVQRSARELEQKSYHEGEQDVLAKFLDSKEDYLVIKNLFTKFAK